jgi:hypothetical protein
MQKTSFHAKPRKARAVVQVATPIYTGQVVHQYLSSYQSSFVDCMRQDIVLAPEFAVGFSLVQYARTWLMKCFMDEPRYTHMMWIDSDLGWDPNAIAKLVNADKDIVGGSYTTKDPTKPMYPFVACGPEDEKTHLQEVSAMPGGFLLMSRKAVEALWFSGDVFTMEHAGEEHIVRHVTDTELVTMDDQGVTKRKLLGEDYVMQVRLRALGFKMYLQTDIEFVHIGPHEWRGNVSKAYAQEKAAGMKTMWHEDAWNKNPRTSFDPRPANILTVPEDEVPHPGLLKTVVSE